MGVQGVRFNIPKSTICTAIINNRGRISHIAKTLDYSIRCTREKINQDPELKALLDEYRDQRDESLLDGCEDGLQDAIDNRSVDMSNALKAIFFVLNTKGKPRGYFPPNSIIDDETKQNLSDLIKQAKTGDLSQK